jgi:DNA-binding MarR family transcriptional regulator
LSLDPGTVSRLAARLERRKLLRREIDSLDRRKQRLTLTRRGEGLAGDHRGTVEGAVREALARATPGEVRLARRFVLRLTEALAVPDEDR